MEQKEINNLEKMVMISTKKLCNQLEISEDFILNIYKEENSWSFISKLAQLIEGIFTKFIIIRLNEPVIYDSISAMQQATRLNLALDLELISKEQKELFLTIAEIRNSYIHNIQNVEITILNYLNSLKKDRLNQIKKRFKNISDSSKLDLFEKFFKKEELTEELTNNELLNDIFMICILEILSISNKIIGLDAHRRHEQFKAQKSLKLLSKGYKNAEMYLIDKLEFIEHLDKAKEVLQAAGFFTSKK